MLNPRTTQTGKSRADFSREVSDAVRAIGNGKWKYDSNVTNAMTIERTVAATGKKETITFSQAYGELSMWLNVSFANISEEGFSDMLAAEFFSGARIHTKKAEYSFLNRLAV